MEHIEAGTPYAASLQRCDECGFLMDEDLLVWDGGGWLCQECIDELIEAEEESRREMEMEDSIFACRRDSERYNGIKPQRTDQLHHWNPEDV